MGRDKIQTVCGMCNNLTCGLNIQTDGRVLTQIQGDRLSPVNQGRICAQAKASLELQNSPLRLETPLRKAKSGWRSITWDEALTEIADRFLDIKERHGGRSLALYQGHSVLTLIRQGWSMRFLSLLESPNLIRNDHLCHMPTEMVERCTYGRSLLGWFDPLQVGCLMLWGNNPFTSARTTSWARLRTALKKDVPLVVIDPRRDRHTEKAALHLAPRPGTDGALAMGIIREMISQGVFDQTLARDKALGFEDLERRLEPCSLAWTARSTGVNREDIGALVRILARHRPLHLATGNALEHHSNSFQTLRAIAILRALAGGLGQPGGNRFLMPPLLADMSLGWPGDLETLGSHKYPLFTRMQQFVPGDALMDSLLFGQPYAVRGALMMGGNPMLTWPHTRQVEQALKSLEFMVAMDTVKTATTELADIILPAAAFWEKDMLLARQILDDQGQPKHNLVMMKSVLPPGQRRSEFWLLSQLARKMGFGAYFPWDSDLTAMDALLEPLGLKHGHIPPRGLLLDGDTKADEMTVFDTPSGKIEFFSNLAKEYDYQPLPEYLPPRESLENSPDLAQQYPLVLNAGGRHIEYAHSQFRHLETLKKTRPEPVAEIHPRTAEVDMISSGDLIVVETLRGRIELKAKVTRDIIPGVVNLKHGWSQANANALTDYRHTDPVLATVALRSGLCRIKPAKAKPPPKGGGL